MLKALRKGAGYRKAAAGLSLAILSRARAPEFFRDLAVPDTFNGRFDMVALHAWLVLDRLDAEGVRQVSQALIDALFYAFEDALRDQGAGDMGMTRRIKKIANAFYGRLTAYRSATGEEALTAALLRNVYSEAPQHAGAAERLAAYALAVRARLAEAELAAGAVDFGPIAAETPL